MANPVVNQFWDSSGNLVTVSTTTDATKHTGPLPVTSTGGGMPAALGQTTAAASLPVVLATDNAGLTTVTGTIADATAITPEVDLGIGKTLVGIITPAGWTAAVLTFQASPTTGGTYYNLYNAAGAEIVTGSIAASIWTPLDPADFIGVRFLKVRSGTSGTPVNQASSDILTCVVRSI